MDCSVCSHVLVLIRLLAIFFLSFQGRSESKFLASSTRHLVKALQWCSTYCSFLRQSPCSLCCGLSLLSSGSCVGGFVPVWWVCEEWGPWRGGGASWEVLRCLVAPLEEMMVGVTGLLSSHEIHLLQQWTHPLNHCLASCVMMWFLSPITMTPSIMRSFLKPSQC